ncbi:MAG: hypothetical protein U0521_09875 [Anaerolineae bacterium]
MGRLYSPDASAVAAGSASNIAPSADNFRTLLLLVDMRVDFVHTDGSLSVPGMIRRCPPRVIEWIFRNLPVVTTIAASLDSHVPLSIFFPTWWSGADERGTRRRYTVIRSDEVRAGALDAALPAGLVSRILREAGSAGEKRVDDLAKTHHADRHARGTLTPALYEAVAYPPAARQAQPIFLQKGTIPQTEFYSILEPEVKVPDHPAGSLNTTFLNTLAGYDRVYVAGEAKSHCVLETVASITRAFADQPAVLDKFYLLDDCMSSVAHPTIDFEALAQQAFARFAEAGVHLVKSSA